jgi:hypothetical protein
VLVSAWYLYCRDLGLLIPVIDVSQIMDQSVSYIYVVACEMCIILKLDSG